MLNVNPEESATPLRPRGFVSENSVPGAGAATKRKRVLFWVAIIMASTLLISCVVRIFLIDIYTVDQGSMEPTLNSGDRMTVNKMEDSAQDISAGDVIVFDGEGSLVPYRGTPGIAEMAAEIGHWLGVSAQPDVYVKRVIGVGGDEIRCCTEDGMLERNGQALSEPYLGRPITAEDPASELEFIVTVPQGRIWVMGDNREDSVDSRALLGAPGGGMISGDRIIGRVGAVIWPLGSDTSINHEGNA